MGTEINELWSLMLRQLHKPPDRVTAEELMQVAWKKGGLEKRAAMTEEEILASPEFKVMNRFFHPLLSALAGRSRKPFPSMQPGAVNMEVESLRSEISELREVLAKQEKALEELRKTE